jgi:hypothetical protein
VSFILALMSFGLSWLPYPFFARGIVYNTFARRGWVPVASNGQPLPIK